MESKKSKKSPSKKQPQLNHEQRVFQLGSQLLSSLKKHRLSREDENIKGIAWFLICVGESLEKGAASKAKEQLLITQAGQTITTPSLAVAFCLKGYEISDWAAGLLKASR